MKQRPPSWGNPTLLECSQFVRGVTYTKSDAADQPASGLLPIVRANNIQARGFEFNDLVYVPANLVSAEQVLKVGDVVVATSSGSISVVGKAVQVRKEQPMSFGAFCGVLRPSPVIHARYFGHFFSSKAYRDAVSDMARGVNINNLKRDHFQAINIPLAPLAEQKRIADKLDTVLTRVDAVNTRLARVAPILKRFRQSVLAAATSGRLTEDLRTDKALVPWRERKYGDISEFHNGYAFKSEIFKSSGDIQVIKLANIKDGNIKLDASPAYVYTQDVLTQITESPNAGDILISMTGTKYKRDYGFVCAVPDGTRLLINQRVGRFVPDKNAVSSKYLMISLMSSDFRDQFFEGETGGVNQGNVGSGHIKNCTFLLPSIHEQAEIVRRVETLFAFADRLEARLQTAKTATERLTPALLAKAFRGELVPQDPNDEPASELLRRLQQEAPSTSAKRGRKSAA